MTLILKAVKTYTRHLWGRAVPDFDAAIEADSSQPGAVKGTELTVKYRLYMTLVRRE